MKQVAGAPEPRSREMVSAYFVGRIGNNEQE